MKNRTGPETSGQPDQLDLSCEPSSLQGDARLGLLHLGVVFYL
ncbi:mCG147590 [Mus musculus]|nr:mCG147590 [Mus musculus]